MNRYIIVGLGNPGQQYQKSRHNAGWLALDYLLEKWHDPSIPLAWKNEKKIHADVVRINYANTEIYALKPDTFMNKSGLAVRAALQWYADWKPEGVAQTQRWPKLLVIHDDLDLEISQYKLQFGKGPKEHNGLNSVRNEIGTDQFWVARLGVDDRQGDRSLPADAYVLQNLPSDQRNIFKQTVNLLKQELDYVFFE